MAPEFLASFEDYETLHADYWTGMSRRLCLRGSLRLRAVDNSNVFGQALLCGTDYVAFRAVKHLLDVLVRFASGNANHVLVRVSDLAGLRFLSIGSSSEHGWSWRVCMFDSDAGVAVGLKSLGCTTEVVALAEFRKQAPLAHPCTIWDAVVIVLVSERCLPVCELVGVERGEEPDSTVILLLNWVGRNGIAFVG
jgi:hypothetical protein